MLVVAMVLLQYSMNGLHSVCLCLALHSIDGV